MVSDRTLDLQRKASIMHCRCIQLSTIGDRYKYCTNTAHYTCNSDMSFEHIDRNLNIVVRSPGFDDDWTCWLEVFLNVFLSTGCAIFLQNLISCL